MSLLKTKDAKKNKSSRDREQLVTLSEARAAFGEERRKKNNEYKRNYLKKYREDWQKDKAEVDELQVIEDVLRYVTRPLNGANNRRSGFYAMKINAHEHAIIQAALKLEGARSSRELFVKLCNEVIKKNN
ncbi:hypothetical protein [Candidatus Enterovibrio altilux]|uniref:Uncharacterized protein n=1 Tax=Candidatus Enterovibrio altilux TaxID=1927128 RepID=A0A291BB15_9GAMM|nr:hypothetical protein [Candidatus Enterovibrio luxaltus]ATF10208.1 hypothetical protein BTN50_1779 [Candidatus Enterovibrio luxaltus]